MASYVKTKNGWRVQLTVSGLRDSACFSKKSDAREWAGRRQSELLALKGMPHPNAKIVSPKYFMLDGPKLYNEQEIIESSVPNPIASGIYFLIKDEKIVYVGQSINVHYRIYGHISSKKFDRVSFVYCAKEDLDKVELAYIRAFNPLLNIAGKLLPGVSYAVEDTCPA